jgi:hypothetical protein
VSEGPKLFTCPRCYHKYLGHDPLPNCPRCGYNYRINEGMRWDLLVYLLAILALVSYFLVSSTYRMGVVGTNQFGWTTGEAGEKLPGAESRQLNPSSDKGRP